VKLLIVLNLLVFNYLKDLFAVTFFHFIFCSFLRPFVVFWARCMFFFGGFHWVTVKGQQVSSREAPILVVAPHSSFFDALPITFLGLPSVVAKTSAQLVPFFGSKQNCFL